MLTSNSRADWKFDMWEWRKRKKIGGTECKSEHRKWNFDMWKWSLRKKDGLESCKKLVFCWDEDIYIHWHDYSRQVIYKQICRKMNFRRLLGTYY